MFLTLREVSNSDHHPCGHCDYQYNCLLNTTYISKEQEPCKITWFPPLETDIDWVLSLLGVTVLKLTKCSLNFLYFHKYLILTLKCIEVAIHLYVVFPIVSWDSNIIKWRCGDNKTTVNSWKEASFSAVLSGEQGNIDQCVTYCISSIKAWHRLKQLYASLKSCSCYSLYGLSTTTAGHFQDPGHHHGNLMMTERCSSAGCHLLCDGNLRHISNLLVLLFWDLEKIYSGEQRKIKYMNAWPLQASVAIWFKVTLLCWCAHKI